MPDALSLLDQAVSGNWRMHKIAIDELAQSPGAKAAFDYLLHQLDHTDDRIRFAALDIMIHHFYPRLQQAEESAIASLFALWRDDCSPVIDRAMWAMHACGLAGLDFVLARVDQQPAWQQRQTLSWLARHPDKVERKETIMHTFERFLAHEERSVRVYAALSMLEMSPVRRALRQEMPGVDFRPYYPTLLSILKEGEASNLRTDDYLQTNIRWLQEAIAEE